MAQNAVPSATLDMAYWDEAGQMHWLRGGRTRLRSFFWRNDDLAQPARATGTHITVAGHADVGERGGGAGAGGGWG